MSTTYSEKLRDPRWQKKRLEIMDRDDFTCLECGSKDKTLNVHHGYYERNKDPWDYEDSTLYTFCEKCHKSRQRIDDIARSTIAKIKTHDLIRYLHYIVCQESKTITGLANHFTLLATFNECIDDEKGEK